MNDKLNTTKQHQTCQTASDPTTPSIAMVMTNAFHKELAKTVRIFVEIEHTFWPERIRQLSSTLWSGHKI
jgi:hypothetical protein